MLKNPTATLNHGVSPSLEDLGGDKDLSSSKKLTTETAMVGAEPELSPNSDPRKRLEPNPAGEVPGEGRL